MANFKTALTALTKGDIDVDALSKQVAALLKQTPQYATRMLSELDERHDQKSINDKDYTRLKSQINQYRRSHATETEGSQESDEAMTVFDRTDDLTEEPNEIDDQTEIDDRTEINDRTQQNTTHMMGSPTNTDTAGFDITGATDMSDVSIDISAATGAGWTDPSTDAPFGPGSIIKQRFRLMDVLGIGGMGKVYKGIDLLKEEAQDKKPHVAIKLLNEDFKDHPEAFISLQRESSRQQKLAHPNIATIYDFDRVGGPGTPVFITMELMEGMELKDYIKNTVKKKGGLPFNKAFKIIEQLVAGLAYAHERRLVHSDFKPGNCFLCNDGTVKTLDFGIARAVKNPVTGEAEKTLFDPGQLGALTPAYASFEMLEGEEPDTRDDIYALGCVAYELLSGKHPFGKLPANKAKTNNLKPFIIKGLKKKQNRALQRSVAFLRKDRSPTVKHFLEELEAKYVWYKSPITVVAILCIAISLGGTVPVLNYYHQKKIEQFVADINTSNPQIISERLVEIDSFEKSDQRTITNDAKTVLQSYFSNRITRLTDVLGDDYNFPQAELVLAEAEVFYPDSNFLKEQAEHISINKRQQLSKLYAEFSDALILAKEQDDASLLDGAQAILNTIKIHIDSSDSLLSDPRASNQYRLLSNNAFNLGNYEKALKLISSGLALTPQDEQQQLVDTKIKIERAINIATLEEKLSATRYQLTSLQDYQAVKSNIIELAELEPTNSVLLPIATSLREIVNQELANILSSGTRADAEMFANEYGNLLSALQLTKELVEIKLVRLSEDERSQARQEIASTNLSVIEQSLQSAELDDLAWESKVLASIRELDSLAAIETTEVSSFTGELVNFRQAIIALYIIKAQKTLDAKRFDSAKNFVTRGKRFSPENVAILDMERSIAEAEDIHEKELLIDGLKKDFRAQTAANQVNKALEYYDEIKIQLPENDIFITEEAPTLLSVSYAQLAKNSFETKDFINALKFADKGMEFNPDNRILKDARTDYVVEANIIDLTEQFNTAISFNTADVQRKIGEISSSVKFTQFRQSSIELLAGRINSLRQSNENVAAKLAQDGAIFFPGGILDDLKNELRLQPWPDAPIATAHLNSGKLTLANTLLQKAIVEFPDHPDVDAFNNVLETNIKRANEVFEQYLVQKEQAGTDYAQLRSIKKNLVRAQSLWIDNSDYDTAETELDELIAANKPASKQIIVRENIDLNMDKNDVALAEWKPTASGKTCEKRLAGYGKRAKAICYDFINARWRGPLMVVVPTGNEFNNNFAISKYEISIGDYGKYCAISKLCIPEKNKEKFHDPLTNISLEQAQAYAKWVTERTGKKYRLPTKNEWEYAADAGGKQPRKDYNCRVALGDKIVKGTGITNVKSGQSNGWGLKNYIGNVQEWVIDGNKTTAKGGAFQDAHSKCSVSFSRDHDGQPDDQTGFRLLLEDVG